MTEFNLSTQDFLDNHLNGMRQGLAIALIRQFGGEDAIMQEYVMALPDDIEINTVEAFDDNDALSALYNNHKEAVIDLGWQCARKQGFHTPLDLYMSLDGLQHLSDKQVGDAMHEQDSPYHKLVSSEIIKRSIEHLCQAWDTFNKDMDSFGERLFNAHHG